MPDSDALKINVMSISWANQFVCLFPPFRTWSILKKTTLKSIRALVIAPLWATQLWFNKLLEVTVDQPLITESKYLQLLSASALTVHSGSAQRSTNWKETSNVFNAAWRDGTKTNINTYSEDSKNFVVKRTITHYKLIHIYQVG